MTMITRTNSFDYNRPPLEFGIEWDTTNPDPTTSITRLGDAASFTVNTSSSPHVSDFSNYWPWAGMVRFNMNSSGDIMWLNGESGYLDSVRTLVRIPFFYFKFEQDTPTTGHNRYWISPYPLPGYRLHPAFLRWNWDQSATRITDIFVGAFEAETAVGNNSMAGVAPAVSQTRAAFRTSINSAAQPAVTIYSMMVDTSGPYWDQTTNNVSGQPYVVVQSTAGFVPGATVTLYDTSHTETKTILYINGSTHMRMTSNLTYSYTQARSGKCSQTTQAPSVPRPFGLIDWLTWNALLWLQLVEYASLTNVPSGSTAQGGISVGITNGAQVEKTGWTSGVDVNQHGFHSVDLHNLSGQVQCNTNGGNPVYAMSYRGIENLYGNVATAIDGVNVNTDKCFWIGTTPIYADQTGGAFAAPYEKTGIYAPVDASATYLKYPGSYAALMEGAWCFGNWVTGGSSSTFTRNQYTPPANWTVAVSPIVGGIYSAGGLWSLGLVTYATTSATTGTRMMQIPLDLDFWRY